MQKVKLMSLACYYLPENTPKIHLRRLWTIFDDIIHFKLTNNTAVAVVLNIILFRIIHHNLIIAHLRQHCLH